MTYKRWHATLIFGLVIVLGALTIFYNLAEVKQLASSGASILTRQLAPRNSNIIYTGENVAKGFLVQTPACTIPDLQEMDPVIKEYIFKERPVLCNKGLPALFEANRTSIALVQEALEFYNVTEPKELSCCYQYFRRESPQDGDSDKSVTYDEGCQPVSDSVNVQPNEEFVRVKCQYSSEEIYIDFFSFVPTMNQSSDDSNAISSDAGQEKLNVLLIGIDAVSRLNFHRQMPKTRFYLEKLKAVELLGYNKIGDNTYPNLIAALTGHHEHEVQELCWPKSESYFDECPFVWKDYKRAGYTTAFGEDAAWMGLFYYQKRGFQQKPTDYYYDHFDIAATREAGNNHRMNVDQCIGSRQAYQIFLDYINNFALTMKEIARPYFGFFWTSSLSHDFLNKPKLGDQDYMNVLFSLDEEGVLNNTALLVISDHGIRWGSIRSTYQGRMEERLPFLYLILPQWYRDKHPEIVRNLKTNVRRLTTPFDLHETFLDILNPERPFSLADEGGLRRGISLFREIPKNRTCKMAGIEQHWCTCQSSVKVEVGADVVVEAVNYTVNYINNLLVGYADCLTLRLETIRDARELTNENELKDYSKSMRDFTVTFKTEPGGAVFEATVRREVVKRIPQYSLTGTVSRINLYGDQSKCITDFHLKLYCYCRSYLGT